MLQERIEAIREELASVETRAELKAIWCHWQCEWPTVADSPEVTPLLREAVASARRLPEAGVFDQDQELTYSILPKEVVQRAAPIRRSAKYQLLKKEVGWSTKPQVKALMHIIGAHANEGDILDERDIVRMCEENVEILATKQGGKRIWDYYKGDHNEGLTMHGNVRKVN